MVDIETVLGPGGLIARRVPAYTAGRAEVELAYAVADALHTGHHLAVEVPPASARTLGYLLAALQRIEADGQRCVISVGSPAAQRALLDDMIPLLRSVLPFEFTATDVQARHNYVSRRRLVQAWERRDVLVDGGAASGLDVLHTQFEGSSRGTRADVGSDTRLGVWDHVKSEHGNCLSHRCKTFETCFYHDARRRSEQAAVLVVTHDLLMSDLALRKHGASLLPDYDFVIVDDADTLPAAADEHFGLRISEAQVTLLLDALFDPHSGRGFLAACHADAAIDAATALPGACRRFFEGMADWHRRRGGRHGLCQVPPAVDNDLSKALRLQHKRLNLLRDHIEREMELFELTSYMERCGSMADLIDEWLGQEREDHAYWIVPGAGSCGGLAVYAPLNLATDLASRLFGEVGAVVVVSSSLSLSDDDSTFAYSRRRFGLRDGYSLRLDTPASQRTAPPVIVETHMPLPDLGQAFTEAAGLTIAEHAIRERTIVVLTPDDAWAARLAVNLRQRLPQASIDVMNDGSEPWPPESPEPRNGGCRPVPHIVLAAAHSGGPLAHSTHAQEWRTLIVPRLPFATADDALSAARVEAINRAGGHAFREYQLPEAILKFKSWVQAWTSCTEQRTVVVLDQRLVSRVYGAEFLAALPHDTWIQPHAGAKLERIRRHRKEDTTISNLMQS